MPARLRPNKASIQTKSARWVDLLAANAFNQMGQQASSPGNNVNCYIYLAVYSLVIAITTASTNSIYPQRSGKAELA